MYICSGPDESSPGVDVCWKDDYNTGLFQGPQGKASMMTDGCNLAVSPQVKHNKGNGMQSQFTGNGGVLRNAQLCAR